jgi:putative transposase
MTKRFAEKQIIGILWRAKADGMVIRDLGRKHNINEQTFFRWRNKYRDDGARSTPAKGPGSRSIQLKKLLAEQLRAIKGLKEIAGKK